MDINDISIKINRNPITDSRYQLSAEEFNAVVASLKELRNMLSTEHQYQVIMQNNLSSNSISVNSGKPCLLKFTFISQERIGFNPWTDTGETGDCKVSIKNALYPNFTVIKNFSPLSSNSQVSFDVSEFLTSGSNQIVITTEGDITGMTTPALIYNVTLTSLSVSVDNFEWWKAYSSSFTIPFRITGGISKILVVSMTDSNNNVIKSEEIAIGTNAFVETPYNYTMEHPNNAGVYTIKAYVKNADGSIQTDAINVNTICYTETFKGKLVAINNIANELTNWATTIAFEYSIFDSDSEYTSAEFVVKKDSTDIFNSDESNISTRTKVSFVIPLEVETIDSSDFNVSIRIFDNDTALTEPIVIRVNNSLGYGAVAGAVTYINPRKRSNRQENYELLINESTGEQITPTWTNMNWSTDGWLLDEKGDNVLRLLANSFVDTKLAPLSVESNMSGKTIEIDYKVSNVTDYENVIVDLSTPHALGFVGLKIFPDYIKAQSVQNHEDDKQTIYVRDSERIRMSFVIMPKAYGNNGFNLCIIYINGVRNKVFYYEDNDYFQVPSTLKIGSDYADIDIYGIRVYDSALTSAAVQKNFANWLETIPEKEDMDERNDILDSMAADIDFANTVDQYNVFVFGNKVPNAVNRDAKDGSLEIYWAGHPEWNASIDNVPCEGQGTSSMFYYRWNLRWKLPKTCTVTYTDGSTTTGKIRFLPDYPEAKRLTAKKNFASSMQSHKIGSVNSMDDLAKHLGIENEVGSRITIYQRPFVGFEKELNEEGEMVYTFIGLYTLGPDKGDDPTFGYDTDTHPNLLSIEGADNAPLLALFRVPWNTNKPYVTFDDEAVMYNGEKAWDYNAGKPDGKKEPVESMALCVKSWRPAYNLVYECSPRLKPFNGTIDELNANKESYYAEPNEFWVTGGDVYYYEASEGQFIPSDIGNGTINLYEQLVDKGYGLTSADLDGKTADEINDLFISARVMKFRNEMGTYFHLDDALLQRNWVEFNAATDNRAKNTYPYIFGYLEDGYKWRWRGDDMDTIFDITNQGEAKKGYGVEFFDLYSDGKPIWNGATSNFWNLIELAFPDECISTMRDFMKAMEDLGGAKTGTSLGNIMAFYQKYYFDVAQNYFPESLYNADSRWTYDYALLAKMDGSYDTGNDTNPMHQSLGDHFEAEKRWISKRILYMMSKYSYGDFSTVGTDIIVVRAAGNTISYQITPAIDMYPIIRTGDSIKQGTRTKAGEVCYMNLTLSGTSDQQNAIVGANYLQDIGEWHDKQVDGTMTIRGKMLRRIKIGDPTADIVISISNLEVRDCVSLQEIILTRVATLGGSVNLSACTHLKRVLAGGTSITNIILPDGGGLEYVEFSPYSQYLALKNYPLLKSSGIVIDDCISRIMNFQVENCPKIDPIALLAEIITAQNEQGENHALKKVRAVGFDVFYDGINGSKILDALIVLANGSYEGLDANGLGGNYPLPVLDGSISVSGYTYEDTAQILFEAFPSLELSTLGYAVRFQDPEILNVLCTKKAYVRRTTTNNYPDVGLSLVDDNEDGYITQEEIDAVRSFSQDRSLNTSIFRGNENIHFFYENRFFKNLLKLNSNFFMDCKNLYACALPGITPPDGDYSENLTSRCYKLSHLIIDEGADAMGLAADCFELNRLDFPSSVKSLRQIGWNLVVLKDLIIRATTPPTMTGFGYNVRVSNIWVPDESVEAYKSATGFTGSSLGEIRPLSELPKPPCFIGKGTIIEENYLAVDFGPDYPYEKGFVWELLEGDEYITLAENGIVTPRPDVWGGTAKVRCTSKVDSSQSIVIDLRVYSKFVVGVVNDNGVLVQTTSIIQKTCYLDLIKGHKYYVGKYKDNKFGDHHYVRGFASDGTYKQTFGSPNWNYSHSFTISETSEVAYCSWGFASAGRDNYLFYDDTDKKWLYRGCYVPEDLFD